MAFATQHPWCQRTGGAIGAEASRRARTISISLAASVVIAFMAIAWHRRWIADDAFIDLVVVRNLAGGHGPVFHVGERVEAFTNPLWVWLLAGALKLTGGAVALETLALWGSLLGFSAGLALALGSSLRRSRVADGVQLPFGLLALVSLSVAWDFATSGLETGLAVLWLGLSQWMLAAVLASPSPRRWRVAVIAWGMGPLVRPELALYAASFFVAWMLTSGAPRGPRALRLAALALLAPLSWQIFRMGYYGLVVPNTALAKEASSACWPQGLRYLGDFARTYAYYVPFGLMSVVLALQVRDRWRHGDGWGAAAPCAGPAAALLHVVYILRVGGDFMHGRMLLPAVMGFALPVMTAPVRATGRRRWLLAGSMVALCAWSVVCALRMRPWYDRSAGGAENINDERRFYVRFAHTPNPVRLEDYRRSESYADAEHLLRLAAQARRTRRRLLLTSSGSPRYERFGRARVPFLPLLHGFPARICAPTGYLGVPGYRVQSAGADGVRYVDVHALSEPLGAHMELAHRGRPGHEKVLPEPWVIGRFARPESFASLGDPTLVETSIAAHETLDCGEVAELMAAVTAPLTLRRFVRNVLGAPARTRLRIPNDPRVARQRFCR